MSWINNIFARRSHKKHTAQEKVAQEEEYWHFTRKILPPTIIEKQNYLILSDGSYATVFIVGVPDFDKPGYPRSINPRFIGDLLDTAQEKCYCAHSFAVKAFGQATSTRAMEDAEFRNIQDQRDDKDTNDGHVRNKTSFIGEEIRADQLDVHKQNKRQFYTSDIIVVRAHSRNELMVSYSHVKNILGKNLVGFTLAEGRMLEAYKSAQPWGHMTSLSRVDCLTSQVAEMLPLMSPDSRTAVHGIWIGNQKTSNPEALGKEIMLDISALSAEHGVVVGPTGSGKTTGLLCMGARAKDQLGYNIIYSTIKEDDRTQYRNFPKYYGEDGEIIDLGVGEGKSMINPLQIVYDTTLLNGKQSEYLLMYHRHKTAVTAFFEAFLKNGLSDNQTAFLDRTLNEVYAKHGIITLSSTQIICHPDKWGNGENFPVIEDLRAVWKEYVSMSGRIRESAESLYDRTAQLSKVGAYSAINQHTTTDLSKGFIVIDMSGLGEGLQDAMSILLTYLISARFSTKTDKKTLHIIDEGVAFTRNPLRVKFLEDALMMGRSRKVTTVISFTQPTDLTPSLAAMLKTNAMWAYLFGKGMESLGSVDYVKEFFKLSDSDADELETSAIGEGLFVLGRQTTPIKFEVTDLEMKIIDGTYNEPEKASTDSAFMVLNSVADMVAEQGVCLNEWLQDPDPHLLDLQGYKPHLIQRVDGNGKAKVWIKFDIIHIGKYNQLYIYNQTVDHYVSVSMIAGHLMQAGFEDVIINHFDDEDVRCRLGDKEFSFEFERPGSHTKAQLVAKMVKIERTGSKCLFVCQTSHEKFVSEAVGVCNTYTRGTKFKAAIDDILDSHNNPEKEGDTDE